MDQRLASFLDIYQHLGILVKNLCSFRHIVFPHLLCMYLVLFTHVDLVYMGALSTDGGVRLLALLLHRCRSMEANSMVVSDYKARC